MQSGTAPTVRPYKLLHQTLNLSGISLQRQTVIGCVQLTLLLNTDYLRHIRLSAKQCRIYRVTLDQHTETSFRYCDPTQDIMQGSANRDLESFSEAHRRAADSVDPQYGRGELVVDVPVTARDLIHDGATLRVGIEFSLEAPAAGLHFVASDGEGSLAERAAHMFSCGDGNMARAWFPCIDSYCDVCTWSLAFTVSEQLVAVSCGELVETVFTPDRRHRTFHYRLTVPTAAPNIGLAVGPFLVHVDPHMNEVTHFCLPHLLPLLKNTAKYTHVAFEFFEEVLDNRFPYACYKQVFVDESYTTVSSYASLSVLSVNLLCPPQVIEQVFDTRRALALALARQYISCFISMTGWSDAWLTLGISAYLTALYMNKFFGSNEHRDWLFGQMREVIAYEKRHGPIVLDNSRRPESSEQSAPTGFLPLRQQTEFHFPLGCYHTVSPHFLDVYSKKALLILRMIEQRIGAELLLQVFNKQLSLAMNACEGELSHELWSSVHMSTSTFVKAIFTVTGKDINVFCDQWVRQGGHAKFHLAFVFNRKRNTVELKLTQGQEGGTCGERVYMGPLLVHLQELDGTFKHTLQIEGVNASADLVCHSKSRRHKKKKIPLCTGEEVDMDLAAMDPDSPVLWIRLDPEFSVIREVTVEQPDYQWQYQLRHERDVTAQLEAVEALARYPSQNSRQALADMLENEQCFYRVRCRCALALASVANSLASSSSGQPVMVGTFRKLFGSKSCPHVVQLNDFENLQLYYVQKTIPVAVARLRNSHGICPPEVLRFLLELFRYNDNSRNKYSDNYYRAALVEALGETVTPVVSMLHQTGVAITPQSLSPDTRNILDEIVRYLNLDKLLPCYKYVVTQACLLALRKLQRCGHLASRAQLFRGYAAYGQYEDVRLTALQCLVDHLHADGSQADLDHLLHVLESDPVPYVRHRLARMLVDRPPFERGRQHPLDTGELAIRLWMLMNSGCALDSRLRCDIVDLYFVLYGRGQPPWIPALSHFPDIDTPAPVRGLPGPDGEGAGTGSGRWSAPRGQHEPRRRASVVEAEASEEEESTGLDLAQMDDLVSVEMLSEDEMRRTESPTAGETEAGQTVVVKPDLLSDESNPGHESAVPVQGDPSSSHKHHKQKKRKKEKKKHKKHKRHRGDGEQHKDRVDRLKEETLSSPGSSSNDLPVPSMDISF